MKLLPPSKQTVETMRKLSEMPPSQQTSEEAREQVKKHLEESREEILRSWPKRQDR